MGSDDQAFYQDGDSKYQQTPTFYYHIEYSEYERNHYIGHLIHSNFHLLVLHRLYLLYDTYARGHNTTQTEIIKIMK
jgi:hypothetical protein